VTSPAIASFDIAFSNGFGIAPGMTLVDDVIAHDVGHVLGTGTLWNENGDYFTRSGPYTGSYGLRTCRDEFDPDAAFVPLDIMRSCCVVAEPQCLSGRFDRDGDGTTSTMDDLAMLVERPANSYFGDENVDGDFNSSDFGRVLAVGKYEDDTAANSTGAKGDWNADGEFSSADLIVAAAAGGYEVGPRAAAASVPELTAVLLATIGCFAVFSVGQRWCCRHRGRQLGMRMIWNLNLGTMTVAHRTRMNPTNSDDAKQRLSEDAAMTPETSIGWLEALKRGDRHATAWRYLVETYGPFLRAILARKGLRAQAADDVVQNVLLVIVRRLPEFERQRTGSFRTWLRSITVNCLRDYWKAEGKHRPAAGACHVQSLIEELQDAHSELSQIWNREHAHHVVGLLLEAVRKDFEPKTIEVFKQLALLKAPVDDVARRFEITPNACFIARSRVMKRLKVLSRDIFGHDDSLDGLAR
jgi:RNA polymerase sigma-70 factor (ECF subfamily)